MDDLDRRILAVLQQDATLTHAELAQRVHSTAATCLRRVNALRAAGVIKAEVAIVDSARAGVPLTVFVEVALERQTADALRAFELHVQDEPAVLLCYEITGDTDFMLMVQAADVDAYQRFARRVIAAFPNVKSFRSIFALNRAKFSTAVALQ